MVFRLNSASETFWLLGLLDCVGELVESASAMLLTH